MICYHRTPAAKVILQGGFRDNDGNYGFDTENIGVWVSEEPAGISDGASGDVVLEVTLPGDADDYREQARFTPGQPGPLEWCIPAVVLNTHGTVRALSEVELDELEQRLHDERQQRADAPPLDLKPLDE